MNHLITKMKHEEEDKLEEIANNNSRIAYAAVAEGNLRNVQAG